MRNGNGWDFVYGASEKRVEWRHHDVSEAGAGLQEAGAAAAQEQTQAPPTAWHVHDPGRPTGAGHGAADARGGASQAAAV